MKPPNQRDLAVAWRVNIVSWICCQALILILNAPIELHSNEYEVHGHIICETHPNDGRPSTSDTRRFSVFVRDCAWLIRVEGKDHDGWNRTREVASTNCATLAITVIGPALGTPRNAFHKMLPELQLFEFKTPSVTIRSNSVPTGRTESELVVPHIWLMFASHCYLQGRSGKELTALYDINAGCLSAGDYAQNFTQTADWHLINGEPALPTFVAFRNTKGLPTLDGKGKVVFVPLVRTYTNALYPIPGVKSGL